MKTCIRTFLKLTKYVVKRIRLQTIKKKTAETN